MKNIRICFVVLAAIALGLMVRNAFAPFSGNRRAETVVRTSNGGRLASEKSNALISSSLPASAAKSGTASVQTPENVAWPLPSHRKIAGKVLAFRERPVVPRSKTAKGAYMREWLVKPPRETAYVRHVEEEYQLGNQGEEELVAWGAYVANQVIVKLDSEMSYETFRREMADRGVEVKPPLMELGKGGLLVAAMVPECDFDTVEKLTQELSDYDARLSPDKDVIKYATVVPNDSRFSSLWGMNKISAPQAWDVRTDASSVLVAVLDTGINYNHEDLSSNMWRNPSPGRVSGIRNDVYGMRCIDGIRSGDPMDDQGHGSHCAGTIAAVGNNGRGVAGVAWRAQVMALKFLDESGSGSSSDELVCLDYARQMGVQVISCSFGFTSTATTGFSERDAFETLGRTGTIFACAAGNESLDNDGYYHNYPSGFDLDNIVAVASSTSSDQLSYFSCYGAQSVDIAAPGSDILSVDGWTTGGYCSMSGTSMATPHVSGMLAMIRAQFPGETHQQTIQRLYSAGDRLPAFTGKMLTGARANLARALTSTALPPPTPTASQGAYEDRVAVSWTSVSGASYYKVFRAKTTESTRVELSGWQTGTTFDDRTTEQGVSYNYWVKAATSATGANASDYSSPAVGYSGASDRDAWDPADDTAQGATLLTPASAESSHGPHTLGETDRYDFFRIEMTSGCTYRFSSESSYDMYAELYRSASAEQTDRVAYDDDSGADANFSLSYMPATSGTYYLRVRCYSVGRPANYSLLYSVVGRMDDWDPADDEPDGATLLQPTAVVQTNGVHSLSSVDESDFFRIELTAGSTYSFSSTGASDVYGELYRGTVSAGSLVAQNDDSGEGRNFLIDYTASVGGTYYLRVRAYQVGTDAEYTLSYQRTGMASVQDEWDPSDDEPTGATTLYPAVSDQTHGPHTLDEGDEYDFFRISLTAGCTYYFESTGNYDLYGELYNAPSASADARVAYNDDGGEHGNFRIAYVPLESGTYYLRVRHYHVGSAASYTLTYRAEGRRDAWDPADDTSEGATVLVPSSTEGVHGSHTLSNVDSYDYYRIEMSVGNTYEFRSTGRYDTIGDLFDSPDGNSSRPVASNDDAEDANFHLSYTPTVSGTYYLRVGCYHRGSDAEYELVYSMRQDRVDVSVSFDANGGTCSVASAEYQVGSVYGELPTAERDGYVFEGWYTSPGDSARVTESSTVSSSVTVLYAHWMENAEEPDPEISLREAVDNTALSFTTGGDAPWLGVANESYDGCDAARSGAIGHHGETWMQTEVFGAGTLVFWWRVSSEGGCDRLRLYVDGQVVSDISGETAWDQVVWTFAEPGRHVVRWTYAKDGSVVRGQDCGWVDQVAWTGAAHDTVGRYLVVDLAGGASGQAGISYLDDVPEGGWTDEYKSSKLVLRRIEPGAFLMGSPDSETVRQQNEDQHRVTLSNPYYIGVFEVTQSQFDRLMRTTASAYAGALRPVDSVTYAQIRGALSGASWPNGGAVDGNSFIGVLRSITGLSGFDLPTEAQWEYACRAGTTSALNDGSDWTGPERGGVSGDPAMDLLGRYWGNESDGLGGYASYTTTVGSYRPNAWGLYDMHGNVWEFCLDWYAESLGSTAVTDPVGPVTGTDRVLRGGSWFSITSQCRSAGRNGGDGRPSWLMQDHGFRVALTGLSETTVTVAFNANGGLCQEPSRTYVLGEPYGAFPVATRAGYEFDGWYTSATDGTRVLESSQAALSVTTLYAQWRSRGENEFFVDAVNGSDLNVGSADAPLKTIGCAISAAMDGATIWVAAGRYAENLTIDKAINLFSTGGVRSTLIVAARTDASVISIVDGGAGSTVRGFTITGGIGSSGYNRYGGGIDCLASATVRDCIISGNGSSDTTFAGGVHSANGAEVLLYNCLICDNFAWACGGATLAEGNSTMTFDRCTVYGNRSQSFIGQQGGISVANTGTIVVRNTIAWGNEGLQIAAYGSYYGAESTGSVSYSCVEGGVAPNGIGHFSSGAGIITSDPRFADVTAGDFSLGFGSPCLNAGDPSSPVDSDGTRADMGFSLALCEGGDGEVTVPLTEALDTTLEVSVAGDSAWFGEVTMTHDGSDAAQSGALSDGQQAWMETEVDGAGIISYWWKVSSERNFDRLVLNVDGNAVMEISGSVDWTAVRHQISDSGRHVIRWTYRKDGSVSSGSDCGWVDQVSWVPFSAVTVTFDANGGICDESSRTFVVGSTYGVLPISTRLGHTFTGWYATAAGGARIDEDTIVDGTRTTLYAGWTANAYEIAFDANGGSGRMASDSAVYGEAAPLPRCEFSRSGHAFIGWSLDPDGDVEFTDGEWVQDLASEDGAVVVLYAIWLNTGDGVSVALEEALDLAAGSVATAGDAPWFGQVAESADGEDAACSGAITDGQRSWMEVEVVGPAFVSFDWRVSSEQNYDWLSVDLDGISQGRISGMSGGWSNKMFFAAEGIHVVRWTYSKDGSVSSGQDCGWVDRVEVLPVDDRLYGAWTAGTWSEASWHADANNLIAGLLPVDVRNWAEGEEGSASVSALTDGSVFSADVGGYYTMGDDASITYEIVPSRVSEVVIYSGWRDSNRNDIVVDSIEVSVDGSSWRTLLNSSAGYSQNAQYNTIGAVDSSLYRRWVRFASPEGEALAEDVSFVRINFGYQDNGYGGFAEIEVLADRLSRDVTVTFDANGGECATERQTYLIGSRYDALPAASREGYVFLGWYTARVGGLRISDDDLADGNVTSLFAQWGLPLGGALDAQGLDFETGGDASWFGIEDPSAQGGSLARSGAVRDSESSWLQVTLSGAGTISFRWKVDSESQCDWLSFWVDGNLVAERSGREDWSEISTEISGAATHVLRWEYAKDGSVSDGADCAWVDDLRWITYVNVSFDGNGGVSERESATYVSRGTYQTLPGATRENHEFVGWFTDPEGGEEVTVDSVVPAVDTVLYAHWTLVTHRVVFDLGRYGTCVGGGALEQLVVNGSSAEEPFVEVADGWKFIGWSASFACVESDLTVRACYSPLWTPVVKEDTLVVYARLYDINRGTFIEGPDVRLAAFSRTGECRGVVAMTEGPEFGLYQLSIGVEGVGEGGFVLKAWDPETGLVLEFSEPVDCVPGKQIGSFFSPKVFYLGESSVSLTLTEGWNWISIPCTLDHPRVNDVFVGCSFANGDVIKAADSLATYWDGVWYPDTFELSPGTAFMVRKSAGGEETLRLSGSCENFPLEIRNGWNWIGSLCLETIPLSRLYLEGGFADEDILKTESAFATYFHGNWYSGEVTAIAPCRGYKMRVAQGGRLSFGEPVGPTGARSSFQSLATAAGPSAWTPVAQLDTMCVYARVLDAVGKTYDDASDWLAAFAANGECRGVAKPIETPSGRLYQLSVAVSDNTERGFTLKYWDGRASAERNVRGTLNANASLQLGTFADPIVLRLEISGGEGSSLTVYPGEPAEIETEIIGAVSVYNLPKGLKYNKATGVISGIATEPTGPEGFRVFFVMPYGAPEELGIVVAPLPRLAVHVDYAYPGCTATGSGAFLVGKKVTLKATAPKGFVFAGWWTDSDEPLEGLVDYRTPSFTLEMPREDLDVYARFVPADEDWEVWIENLDYEEIDGPVTLPLQVYSQSLPTIAIKGLPKGLKFDAKKLEISGTPTVPGVYECVATLKNQTVKTGVTQNFTIRVPNLVNDVFCVGDYDFEPGEPFGVISLFDAMMDIRRADPTATLTVSGLPKGLVYDKNAFSITGVPTKPGAVTVTFTAKGKIIGTVLATATYMVWPYPELVVRIPEEVAEAGGKVTGSGNYLPGSKVTLKATAPKGYVFAGWYSEDENFNATYSEVQRKQNPFTYVAQGANPEIWAEFISARDDFCYVYGLFEGGSDFYETIDFLRPVDRGLGIESGSTLTSVKVTGLPAGLKFDAKGVRITGAPTKAGIFYVTVEAKNASGYQHSAVFCLNVGNIPVPDNGCLPGLPAGGTIDLALQFKTSDYYESSYLWSNITVGEYFWDNLYVDIYNAVADRYYWADIKSVKVTGLPAGLKFVESVVTVGPCVGALAPWRVEGVPTKPGVYTMKMAVTLDNGQKADYQYSFIVRNPGSAFVDVRTKNDGAKVSGTGVYPIGSTVKLSATAPKDHVFAGWEVEGSELLADRRQASATLEVYGPTTAWADFVRKDEDDTVDIGILCYGDELPVDPYDGLPVWRYEGCDSVYVDVASYSMPKLTAKGLPPGCVLDAQWGDIWFKTLPKKPGTYVVTVSAANQSGAKADCRFKIVIPNLRSEVFDGLEYEEAYRLTAGATGELPGFEVWDGWKVTASGLPAGVKLEADGSWYNFAGVPTKAGTYTVTLTAKGYGGTEVATVTFVVDPLPDWLVGRFTGTVTSGEDVTALIAVDAAANGKISLTVTARDGTKKAYSVPAWSAIDDGEAYLNFYPPSCCSEDWIELMVRADASWYEESLFGGLAVDAGSGRYVTGEIRAQRNPFGKVGKDYENEEAHDIAVELASYGAMGAFVDSVEWGRCQLVSPDGFGGYYFFPPDIKFTVTADGVVKVAGSIYGASVSGSATLRIVEGIPQADFLVGPKGALYHLHVAFDLGAGPSGAVSGFANQR